jgi:hypothetical protein
MFMWLNPKFNMLAYQKNMYNNLIAYTIKNDNLSNLLFNEILFQSLKYTLCWSFLCKKEKYIIIHRNDDKILDST